jgi:ubiquinone/menaquinone biosynthesis C-methylase UbiE
MGNYYPGGYGPHHVQGGQPDRLQALINRLHNSLCVRFPFFDKRQAFFSSMQPGDLLLDYGCGGGDALDLARGAGARTLGIDFADSLLSGLRSRGHQTALADSDWQSQVLSAGGATHIRLNHSLEHLHAPQALIADLARVARPGARLHISVPNPQGISARCFGRYWRGLEAPRHIVIFSASQIANLLTTHGFERVEPHTEPTAKDFARSFSVVGK